MKFKEVNKDKTRKNLQNKLKLKVGDKVVVICGKDKGKIGQIVVVYTESRKVIVEGVNLKTLHKKQDPKTGEGGKIKVERPIDISNVMFYSDSIKGPSRIAYKVNKDGLKVRFCVKTGEEIEEKKKK